MKALSLGSWLYVGLIALWSSGCTTESYCFDDCENQGNVGGSGNFGDGGPNLGGSVNVGGGGGGISLDSGLGGGGGCIPAAPGLEVCGADNDCNGSVDTWDYTRIDSCGTCAQDCTSAATCQPNDPNCTVGPHSADPTCEPPSVLDGNTPGRCTFTMCEPDYYDIDPNIPGCEYYCRPPYGLHDTDLGGENCNIDDDCDGTKDEDLDLCSDVNNCGACSTQCSFPNATARCVTTAAPGEACTATNTRCVIDECAPGWVDANPAQPGCETQCVESGTGPACADNDPATHCPELCDGLDNDCDGKIDNADDSLEADLAILGDQCFGGTNGECAAAAHAGIRKCIGNQVLCCDAGSNNVASTNPNFPVNGVRNGVCEATSGGRVLTPGEQVEICDGLDNDCNGLADDNPTDAVGLCAGSDIGLCFPGAKQCINGAIQCVGQVAPGVEVCNQIDDDCDGVIDGRLPAGPVVACTGAMLNNPACAPGQFCMPRSGPNDRVCVSPASDVGTACGPPGPPAGATSPCTQGTLICVGGATSCEGATFPQSPTDSCGRDDNCNGVMDITFDTNTDVKNCGACGNDCTALGGNASWTCEAGQCVRCPGGVCPNPGTGCNVGFINCDGNANDCERACIKTSNSEICNGADDDCDCQIDEAADLTVPSPAQVCGVAPGASSPECTAGTTANRIRVTCSAGSWSCQFPTGVCTGGNCAGTAELCDGLDNDCNGGVDETFKNNQRLDQPCMSDDGLPAPGHGACRTSGAIVCTSTTTTGCNAMKDNSRATTEDCDGADNDCDGSVDEPFTAKGTNTTHFVRPAVTRIGTNLWVYQYEASRPGATATSPGSGNGYHTTAPSGATLDRTPACSTSGVLPWFNVTPVEAEQTCTARGGRLCRLSDWQTACRANTTCTYGYAPRTDDGDSGSTINCSEVATSPYSSSTRRCNIGLFDFDTSAAGIQNALLPTASSRLSNCFADWNGLQGNPTANNNIRDIMGNLRELVRDTAPNPDVYRAMGGAFTTQVEAGATCDYTFYALGDVGSTAADGFKLYDSGFRCCFTSNPTL